MAGVLHTLLRLPFQVMGQYWYMLTSAVFALHSIKHVGGGHEPVALPMYSDHMFRFLQSVAHAVGSIRPVKLTPDICPPFKFVSCAIAAEGN